MIKGVFKNKKYYLNRLIVAMVLCLGGGFFAQAYFVNLTSEDNFHQTGAHEASPETERIDWQKYRQLGVSLRKFVDNWQDFKANDRIAPKATHFSTSNIKKEVAKIDKQLKAEVTLQQNHYQNLLQNYTDKKKEKIAAAYRIKAAELRQLQQKELAHKKQNLDRQLAAAYEKIEAAYQLVSTNLQLKIAVLIAAGKSNNETTQEEQKQLERELAEQMERLSGQKKQREQLAEKEYVDFTKKKQKELEEQLLSYQEKQAAELQQSLQQYQNQLDAEYQKWYQKRCQELK